MTEKEISKDDARKILQEHLVKAVEITDQKPTFGSIYKAWPKNRVWYARIPSTGCSVGGSRIIIISKETGRIYFDGMVEE